MIDLSNFKTFDFSEGVPYISITSNGITFNKSVIMKMKYLLKNFVKPKKNLRRWLFRFYIN